eukprot:GEMP01067201.1.p1 GENE.GEMP01067201.1~~GEMP01067201.1.p1  ORF type:complete len:244 (+),score=54.18 GEMP01067201.1:60-791(+)
MCDDWDLACPPREIVWKRSPRENDNEDTIIWRDYSPPPLWGANKTTEPGFCAPEDAVGPGYSGARNHARKRGIPEQHLQNSTRARLSRKLEAWGDTRRVEARGHRDEGPLGEAPRSYSWNDDEISHFSNTSLVHVRIPFEDTVLHSESEEEEEVSDTECPVASFTALKRATAFPPQESSEELEDTTKSHDFLFDRPLTEVESLQHENAELRGKLRELQAQHHHDAPDKSLMQHIRVLVDLINR